MYQIFASDTRHNGLEQPSEHSFQNGCFLKDLLVIKIIEYLPISIHTIIHLHTCHKWRRPHNPQFASKDAPQRWVPSQEAACMGPPWRITWPESPTSSNVISQDNTTFVQDIQYVQKWALELAPGLLWAPWALRSIITTSNAGGKGELVSLLDEKQGAISLTQFLWTACSTLVDN